MSNVPDIFKGLPQRYPFLMVDRVMHVDKENITVLKNVTNNEPHFQGHFPSKPIMPGVLILEAMLQAGGMLAGYIREAPIEEYLAYVTTIDRVRFRKPVIPGDQLYLKVSTIAVLGTAWKFVGKAYVDEVLVTEASWMAVVVKDENNE